MKTLFTAIVVASGMALMNPVMACDGEPGVHTQLAQQEQAAPVVKKANTTVAKAETVKPKAYNPRYDSPFE